MGPLNDGATTGGGPRGEVPTLDRLKTDTTPRPEESNVVAGGDFLFNVCRRYHNICVVIGGSRRHTLSPNDKEGALLLVPAKEDSEESHSFLFSSMTRGESEVRSSQEESQVFSNRCSVALCWSALAVVRAKGRTCRRCTCVCGSGEQDALGVRQRCLRTLFRRFLGGDANSQSCHSET